MKAAAHAACTLLSRVSAAIAVLGLGLLGQVFAETSSVAIVPAPSLVLAPSQSERSVYALEPLADGAVIAGSVMGVLVPYSFASSFISGKRCPCDPGEVNAFDRPAIGNHSDVADRASDVLVALALALPIVLDAADVGVSPVLVEDLVVYAEVLAVTGVLVTASKYVFQRPMPVVYSQDDLGLLNAPGGYRSFYSGHAAMGFAALSAAAMTIGARHGRSELAWIAVFLLGGTIGALKIEAGRHFPSDVLVGSAMGLAVGITVPWLHRRW